MSTTHIGVDGGGTRARAVLVDDAGGIIARSDGPAGIVRTANPAAAAAVVAQLARTLLEPTGRPRATTLCCGLAGAGRSAEREAVRQALAAAGVATAVHVVSDAEAAMADAFGTTPGILLIAGTGSIAWATAADGATLRVGGWGQLLGDEGSGYAIGLAGLRAVVRAADGRQQRTGLTAVLLNAAGLDAPDALVAFAEGATKADVAAFAPHVLRCAQHGDAAAVQITRAAVAELVTLAVTAALRAGMPQPAVALGGGLIAPGGQLRDPVATELRRHGCTVLEAAVDAARGAALIGRRMHP